MKPAFLSLRGMVCGTWQPALNLAPALGASPGAIALLALGSVSLSHAQPSYVKAWGGGTGIAQLVPGVSQVLTVSAGARESFASQQDGSVWSWTLDSFGKPSVPTQVSGLTDIVTIAAGRAHALALRSDGTVWAWGNNAYGQLGIGSFTDSSIPVQSQGIYDIVAICAGEDRSLALRGDGSIWEWGRSIRGAWHVRTPVNITQSWSSGFLSNSIAIAAGNLHSLALRSDGSVFSWGYNGYGQLGYVTALDYNLQPRQVIGMSRVASIASGYRHSLALRDDGRVWAWGQNWYGQLGDGTSINRFGPVLTEGISEIVSIAGGEGHSLALSRDGLVWAWGWNGFGQLGDGTDNHIGNSNSHSRVPIQSQGLNGSSFISGGQWQSVAVHGGSAAALTGIVNLEDIADEQGSVILVEICPIGSNVPLVRRLVVLGSGGSFSLPISLRGDFDLAIRGPSWLRKDFGTVSIGDAGLTGLYAQLVNGDVTGDNVIDIGDFLGLRAFFGTDSSNPNWRPSADLNGDGAVNIQDFAILRRNFGRDGD